MLPKLCRLFLEMLLLRIVSERDSKVEVELNQSHILQHVVNITFEEKLQIICLSMFRMI